MTLRVNAHGLQKARSGIMDGSEAVMSLLSDSSGWGTGHTRVRDGGLTLARAAGFDLPAVAVADRSSRRALQRCIGLVNVMEAPK